MALLKINGRTRFLNRVTAVDPIRPGHWDVQTKHHGTFHVEGGRKAGGGTREWFLENPQYFNKALRCTSMMDALRCIETM